MTREELIEKVAKALIDVDYCIDGYHESHIRLKTPDAKAAIDIVLEEAAKLVEERRFPFTYNIMANQNATTSHVEITAAKELAEAIRALKGVRDDT